ARKLANNEFFGWIAVRGFTYPAFWKPTNPEAIQQKRKPASEQMIIAEVRRAYDIAKREGTKPPNINEVAKPVYARLREIGQTASAAQIKRIAERPEFKKRRRPAGKTVLSEKRGPQK